MQESVEIAGLHVDFLGVPNPIATVSIVHGVADHGRRYARLRECLARAGIASQTVDLRGHGLSRGPRADVDDFRSYLVDVAMLRSLVGERSVGVPHFLLGHSMGGVVAALSARSSPDGLAGVVLLAPAFRLATNWTWLMRLLTSALARIAPGIRIPLGLKRDLTHDAAMQDEDEHDAMLGNSATVRWAHSLFRATSDIDEILREVRLPVLIMHGESDRIAALEGSRAAFAVVARATRELVVVRGARHELFRERPSIRESVFAHIVSWIHRVTKGTAVQSLETCIEADGPAVAREPLPG